MFLLFVPCPFGVIEKISPLVSKYILSLSLVIPESVPGGDVAKYIIVYTPGTFNRDRSIIADYETIAENAFTWKSRFLNFLFNLLLLLFFYYYLFLVLF